MVHLIQNTFRYHLYGFVFNLNLTLLHGLFSLANFSSSFRNRVILAQLLVKHANDVLNLRHLASEVQLFRTHVAKLADEILVLTIVLREDSHTFVHVSDVLSLQFSTFGFDGLYFDQGFSVVL